MFIICRVFDPTIDELEDGKIAISKPFQITGGNVSILIKYGPDDAIRAAVKPGSQIMQSTFLLPKDLDGSTIRKLGDVYKQNGKFLLPRTPLEE